MLVSVRAESSKGEGCGLRPWTRGKQFVVCSSTAGCLVRPSSSVSYLGSAPLKGGWFLSWQFIYCWSAERDSRGETG